MRRKVFFLMVKHIIFCLYCSVNAKTMMGQPVRQANQNEFPFVVGVMTLVADHFSPTYDAICTGALITTKDVLTSDYCLKGRLPVQVYVYAGNVAIINAIKYTVNWWVSYDTYAFSKNIMVSDVEQEVSIVRLLSNVTNITPAVFLPTPKSSLFGLEVQVAGWVPPKNPRDPNVMRTSSLTVIDDSNCKQRLQGYVNKPILIDEFLFCSYRDPYVLLTLGDYGGPVLYLNKIVGVNKGPCPTKKIIPKSQQVNVHYHIDFYMPFITDVTNYN